MTSGATATPAPTLGGNIDLASLIPKEISGNKMTLEPASDSARSFLILWNDEQIARDLLARLGRSEKDVSIVFAYASDATYPERVAVNAYRVAGADGVALRDGMLNAYVKFFQASSPTVNPTVTPTELGGKDTVVLSAKGAPAEAREYFYAYSDIVFNVNGNPPAWVEDAFSQLP